MSRILVVDDEPDLLYHLQEALKRRGFETLGAGDGEAALKAAFAWSPDLVLMDVMIPKINGMEVCRRLKQELTTFVPVVLMTAKGDLEQKLSGFEHGADDFLTKPFAMEELLARTASMIRTKRLHDELLHASITDGLTGIYNRRYFQLRLAEECWRAVRYGPGFSCLMIDIDRFKELNDRHGHPFGDEVLKEVVHLIQRLIRKVDLFFRYGGEEFVVILPDTHLEEARSLAERIRIAVGRREVRQGGKEAAVTCSIGVAVFPTAEVRDMHTLVTRLDAALYEAKRAGRNRIYVSGEEAREPGIGSREAENREEKGLRQEINNEEFK